jgi:general stress protein CsbA
MLQGVQYNLHAIIKFFIVCQLVTREFAFKVARKLLRILLQLASTKYYTTTYYLCYIKHDSLTSQSYVQTHTLKRKRRGRLSPSHIIYPNSHQNACSQ